MTSNPSAAGHATPSEGEVGGEGAPPLRLWRQWLALALAATALASIMGLERYAAYEEVRTKELARLQTLARVMDSNLIMHFEAIDLLIRGLRDARADRPPLTAAERTALEHELKFYVETTPGVRTLSIADADGTYVASSRPELVGNNYADRAFFRKARETRDPELLIVSEPYVTQLGTFSIQFVRPILGGDGAFRGAVTLTLDPELFGSMLSAAMYADDLRCLLIHEDGTVFQAVGEFKAQPGINLRRPGSLLAAHYATGQIETVVDRPSFSTGDRRLGVLRTVVPPKIEMDRHLVIAFTRNWDSTFADWREQSLRLAALALLGIAVAGAALGLYGRQQRADRLREELLARERRAVAAERERAALEIESLYDRAPCGYHSLDADGRFVRINQTELDWLGYARDEVVGARGLVDFVDNGDVATFQAHWQRVVETGESHGIELRMRRRDGSHFWVILSADAVRDDAGRFVMTRATVTDITARKRAEAELHARTVETEAASVAKSRFLANISHEIRTPLNAMIALTGVVLESPLAARQRDQLQKVQSAGSVLLAVLNEVLDYSKIEAGFMHVESVRLSMRDVAERCRAMFAIQAAEKGLALAMSIHDDVPPELLGDPVRLLQVTSNLVGNALKFTSAGSVTVSIDVAERAEGSVLLRVAVRDTGIGVAPAQRERLFEAFQQAEASTSRQYGGTGLGLAISKRLAELMGGEIGVESADGAGSTFWFTARLGLPRGPLDRAFPVRSRGTAVTGPGQVAPAGVGAQRPVDEAELKSRLRELARLLEAGQVTARRCSAEVEALVAGTLLQREYAGIVAAIAEFDFALALDGIRALAAARQWEL